MDQKMITQFYQ